MRKYAVALTFLLVVSGCGGSPDASPVTTQAPATTASPVTTQAPATTAAPVTTQAPATTASPVTTQAPTTTVPTTTAAPTTTSIPTAAGYDYRLDEANVLNHLRPENEACLRQKLGDVTLAVLRTRPMDYAEADRAMRCFGQPSLDPVQPVD